jgi:hypothetical protein
MVYTSREEDFPPRMWCGSAPPFGAPVGSTELEPVYKRIALRIMPFLILLHIMSWLDRVNIGFAKLTMSTDLGFSEAVYGFGAGISSAISCSRFPATSCSRRSARGKPSGASHSSGGSAASR